MKIQLLYFEGCPSYMHALENLNFVLSQQGIKTSVEIIQVASPAEAKDLNFLGSPTIQIDGVDLEGTNAVKAGIGYGCRVYKENGQMRGWPSKEHIQTSLNKLINS